MGLALLTLYFAARVWLQDVHPQEVDKTVQVSTHVKLHPETDISKATPVGDTKQHVIFSHIPISIAKKPGSLREHAKSIYHIGNDTKSQPSVTLQLVSAQTNSAFNTCLETAQIPLEQVHSTLYQASGFQILSEPQGLAPFRNSYKLPLSLHKSKLGSAPFFSHQQRILLTLKQQALLRSEPTTYGTPRLLPG